MTEEPYIFDSSSHELELARLRVLERVFDDGTTRCLRATGVAPGWRCLEVGAGAGSVTEWLCAVVGSTGRVVALDINTRFLRGRSFPQLEVREADIAGACLELQANDLAHVRFVLIHVSRWDAALENIVASIKPGGWLVLEEPDFSSSRVFAADDLDLRSAFECVHRAIEAMFRTRGLDYAFGARLPRLLQRCGFQNISVENDAPVVRGGSPQAMMMAMSTAQLADAYVGTGLATRSDLERYERFATDPTSWATYHGTIRAMGQKPRVST